MRVLGVDPGLRLTGYGCVEGVLEHRPRVIEAGVVRLVPARATGRGVPGVSERLDELDREFRAVLERTEPALVAVEALFAHYKHPATAIVMGHARGVLLLAVRRAGLPVIELKPAEVKKATVGHGAASKRQMQSAVRAAFGLEADPEPADVADALAIALCGGLRWGTARALSAGA